MSDIQIALMGPCAVALYSVASRSGFMCRTLSFLTCGCFVWLIHISSPHGYAVAFSTRGSPGSLVFDISFDHHNADGGITMRLLQVFLTQGVRPERVFYDFDYYLNRNMSALRSRQLFGQRWLGWAYCVQSMRDLQNDDGGSMDRLLHGFIVQLVQPCILSLTVTAI